MTKLSKQEIQERIQEFKEYIDRRKKMKKEIDRELEFEKRKFFER